MTEQPHEAPAFRNAATYSIELKVTVRGGARRHTADRRAEQVAEKLCNHAARLSDVVAVTATAGRSVAGEVILPQRVRFAAANSGLPGSEQDGRLACYLDPDHERALRSLAQAQAREDRLREADRQRRRALSCRNTYAVTAHQRERCPCVYCDPETHWRAARGQGGYPGALLRHLCLCGAPVAAAGERCVHHRHAPLVVLDGDGSALQLLVRDEAGERDTPARHRPDPAASPGGPDPELEP
jgi:hypothetical protein